MFVVVRQVFDNPKIHGGIEGVVDSGLIPSARRHMPLHMVMKVGNVMDNGMRGVFHVMFGQIPREVLKETDNLLTPKDLRGQLRHVTLFSRLDSGIDAMKTAFKFI